MKIVILNRPQDDQRLLRRLSERWTRRSYLCILRRPAIEQEPCRPD